ncbi:hypothetical protein [Arthrobacter sp. NPDC056727]|uniref:hypothetical protein n=1 Tax=Arthrobacter sp. NPDC056727 TaxID=3345927 RepID=UPI0036702EBF
MDPLRDQDISVLNVAALQDLADDAGEAAAQAFMEDYLLLLFARTSRILHALAANDTEESLDALLSLRTSSEIAGAIRLASYCRVLETRLKTGQESDLATVRAELPTLIRALIREASRRGHLPSRPRVSET